MRGMKYLILLLVSLSASASIPQSESDDCMRVNDARQRLKRVATNLNHDRAKLSADEQKEGWTIFNEIASEIRMLALENTCGLKLVDSRRTTFTVSYQLAGTKAETDQFKMDNETQVTSWVRSTPAGARLRAEFSDDKQLISFANQEP